MRTAALVLVWFVVMVGCALMSYYLWTIFIQSVKCT